MSTNRDFEDALLEHSRRGAILCGVIAALGTLTQEQLMTTMEEVRPAIYDWFSRNMADDRMAWLEAHNDPDFAMIRAMVFMPNTDAPTLGGITAGEVLRSFEKIAAD